MTLSTPNDEAISAKAWVIVAWVFALFMGIIAVGAAARGPVSGGLLLLLSALSIAPWTADLLGWLFRIKVPGWARVFTAIAFIVAASFRLAPAEQAIKQATHSELFLPSQRGVRLGKMALRDDFDAYLGGHKSVENWSSIQQIDVRTTPADLWSAYHDNEVSADTQFKDKAVAVSGKVESISKDAFGSVYLALFDGNPFEAVHANLDDESANSAGALSRGDAVELFCEGHGMILGSPVLGKCQLKAIVLAHGGESLDDKVEIFFSGAKVDLSDKIKLSLGILYSADQLLPDDSKCNSEKAEELHACLTEARLLPRNQIRKAYEALAQHIALPAMPAEILSAETHK